MRLSLSLSLPLSLFLSVCVCVCMHVYVYVWMVSLSFSLYVCVYVCMYMHVCGWCTCMSVCACGGHTEVRAKEVEVAPGVSPADVAECCRVLDALGIDMQLVTASPSLKSLRKSLIPFLQAESVKRFRGGSREENDKRRQAAQDSNRAQQQAKASDQRFIENTLLRAGRRAKLDALKDAHNDDDRLLLLVPDGLGAPAPPVARGACPAITAPDGEGAQRDGQAGAEQGQVTDGVLITPTAPPLNNPRACYTCKVRFTQLHFFYDQVMAILRNARTYPYTFTCHQYTYTCRMYIPTLTHVKTIHIHVHFMYIHTHQFNYHANLYPCTCIHIMYMQYT